MCKFFNSYEEFPSKFALFPQNFTQLGIILQDRRSHRSRQISRLLKNSINHDSNRLGLHANLVMSTMIDHDHIVKLSIRRVEEMGSGAAYCQLMDLLYPGEDNVAIIISHDIISK